jgi:hypothetical protein
LLAALQPHPLPAVTVTLPLPPEEGIDCESGEMANVQPSPCVIVTIWLAMVTVPVRVGPVGSTVMTTDPLPAPLAAESAIQLTLLLAIHGQPAAAVMVSVCVPPEAPTE